MDNKDFTVTQSSATGARSCSCNQNC